MPKKTKKDKTMYVLHLYCYDAKTSDLYANSLDDAVDVLDKWLGDNQEWKENKEHRVVITVEKMTQSKWDSDLVDTETTDFN